MTNSIASCKKNKARELMIEKVTKTIKNNGFDPNEIIKKSIYELEEEYSIGHYNVISRVSSRSGYMTRGNYSKKRTDDSIRYLLTR